MNLRFRLHVTGIVQGVGFRPFVYRLAHECQLTGFVVNNSRGVFIEVQGSPESLADFTSRLQSDAPPLARIKHVTQDRISSSDETAFRIKESERESGEVTMVPPDISVCEDCLRELTDAADPRFNYALINCTNCGPRFTIITDLPYDRPYTTMAGYPLCPDCRREYLDPHNRRFHAQPTACPICGPEVRLDNLSGMETLAAARRALADGKILAVKGIGGYHLAVDARDDAAVLRLRERKHRFGKPLAVMVNDIATAHSIAHINSDEEILLNSPERPIVICAKIAHNDIAQSVSPDNDYLGILLPYTPLHHLLFAGGEFDALVMTSANISEEPICADDADAKGKMGQVADFFLTHDRPIHIRCDDSVVRSIDGVVSLQRRSRGYVPVPVYINPVAKAVIATGGHLKNTVCLAERNRAILSQHIGDLENLETLTVFEQSIAHLTKLFRIDPAVVACDLHPDYLSTKWAMAQDLPVLQVQHHYAHALSVLAEHQIDEPVIALTFDGTGYGSDGAVWGGEFLICDRAGFSRIGQFEYVPLPGSAQTILNPWRMAAGLICHYFPDNWADYAELFGPHCTEVTALHTMISKKINTPDTSSCGRLFDAVAALLGAGNRVSYEGQAAVKLEAMARQATGSANVGDFGIHLAGDYFNLSIKPVLERIFEAVQSGAEPKKIARGFHESIIRACRTVTIQAARKSRISKVVLSGGCFQNAILLSQLRLQLKAEGLDVYTNQQVPANDGGISLGQAYHAGHIFGK